jgi:hypothetical protein
VPSRNTKKPEHATGNDPDPQDRAPAVYAYNQHLGGDTKFVVATPTRRTGAITSALQSGGRSGADDVAPAESLLEATPGTTRKAHPG